jgi:ankyrin repeat protein
MFARDTINGDTALHLACKNRNVDIVKAILLNSETQKCLMQNYKG